MPQTVERSHRPRRLQVGITHSICTLEFEDHRPLYEWLLEKLPATSPTREG